jgi:hypothetical protein
MALTFPSASRSSRVSSARSRVSATDDKGPHLDSETMRVLFWRLRPFFLGSPTQRTDAFYELSLLHPFGSLLMLTRLMLKRRRALAGIFPFLFSGPVSLRLTETAALRDT